jgi:hypothetical protein
VNTLLQKKSQTRFKQGNLAADSENEEPVFWPNMNVGSPFR